MRNSADVPSVFKFQTLLQMTNLDARSSGLRSYKRKRIRRRLKGVAFSDIERRTRTRRALCPLISATISDDFSRASVGVCCPLESSINDVTHILYVFGSPPSTCHRPLHANYQYYCHILANSPQAYKCINQCQQLTQLPRCRFNCNEAPIALQLIDRLPNLTKVHVCIGN